MITIFCLRGVSGYGDPPRALTQFRTLIITHITSVQVELGKAEGFRGTLKCVAKCSSEC